MGPMFFVNVVLAFVASLTAWVVCSTLLSSFIFRTETRHPEVVGRTVWNIVETALVFTLFVGAVGLWIGLTYVLQQAIK